MVTSPNHTPFKGRQPVGGGQPTNWSLLTKCTSADGKIARPSSTILIHCVSMLRSCICEPTRMADTTVFGLAAVRTSTLEIELLPSATTCLPVATPSCSFISKRPILTRSHGHWATDPPPGFPVKHDPSDQRNVRDS